MMLTTSRLRSWSAQLLSGLLLTSAVTACRVHERGVAGDGPWAGDTIVEGDVTTVVNASGSEWGGSVVLVEDLSIGVESGADAYMFGRVSGLESTEDRIYVADSQLSAVRVYDRDGNHLFDFGRQGQGPGEFDYLGYLAIDPTGRVFVPGNSRITVFDLDGNLLDTWPYEHAGADQLLTVGADGTAYVPTSWAEEGRRRSGFIAVSPDGGESRRISGPELDDGKWRMMARGPGGIRGTDVPYAPRGHWTVLSSGGTVQGSAEAYSFEVEYPDHTFIIERRVELPVIPPDESDWQMASITASMRRYQPDWEWNGPPIPDRLPPYLVFLGDRHGRIWLLRMLGLEPVSDCDRDPAAITDRPPRPCYQPIFGFDVFREEDGHFMGEVRLPGWFRNPPHFMEDAILWAVEDEQGTIQVKRFRMVPPGATR